MPGQLAEVSKVPRHLFTNHTIQTQSVFLRRAGKGIRRITGCCLRKQDVHDGTQPASLVFMQNLK